MRRARCEFCGGPATVGGTDDLGLSFGEQQMTYQCLDCAQEFNRFTRRVLNKRIPDGMSRQKQLEAIRKLRDDAQRHMQQWLLKKKAR